MSEKKKLDSTADMLEELMQKALEAYDMDVEEADQVLTTIKAAMGTSKLALEQYGTLLNETLRTKAQVRDRLLKLIGMLAQRVRVNEVASKGGDGTFFNISPEETMLFIENVQKQKKDRDADKDEKGK